MRQRSGRETTHFGLLLKTLELVAAAHAVHILHGVPKLRETVEI